MILKHMKMTQFSIPQLSSLECSTQHQSLAFTLYFWAEVFHFPGDGCIEMQFTIMFYYRGKKSISASKQMLFSDAPCHCFTCLRQLIHLSCTQQDPCSILLNVDICLISDIGGMKSGKVSVCKIRYETTY